MKFQSENVYRRMKSSVNITQEQSLFFENMLMIQPSCYEWMYGLTTVNESLWSNLWELIENKDIVKIEDAVNTALLRSRSDNLVTFYEHIQLPTTLTDFNSELLKGINNDIEVLIMFKRISLLSILYYNSHSLQYYAKTVLYFFILCYEYTNNQDPFRFLEDLKEIPKPTSTKINSSLLEERYLHKTEEFVSLQNDKCNQISYEVSKGNSSAVYDIEKEIDIFLNSDSCLTGNYGNSISINELTPRIMQKTPIKKNLSDEENQILDEMMICIESGIKASADISRIVTEFDLMEDLLSPNETGLNLRQELDN